MKHTVSKNFFTEPEMQRWLGMSSEQLAKLRQEQKFPFVQINRTTRMYYMEDVFEWLRSRRQNIID